MPCAGVHQTFVFFCGVPHPSYSTSSNIVSFSIPVAKTAGASVSVLPSCDSASASMIKDDAALAF